MKPADGFTTLSMAIRMEVSFLVSLLMNWILPGCVLAVAWAKRPSLKSNKKHPAKHLNCHRILNLLDYVPPLSTICHNIEEFCDKLHYRRGICHKYHRFCDNQPLQTKNCHIYAAFCDTSPPEGNSIPTKKRPPELLLKVSEGWRLPTLPLGIAVPSALTGLTSLFGMGRGGSPSLLPPFFYRLMLSHWVCLSVFSHSIWCKREKKYQSILLYATLFLRGRTLHN